MHLILVSNRMATAKTVTITPRLAVLLAFAFLGVVLSAALLFSSLGLRWPSPAVDRSVSDPALASLPPTSHSDASDFVRGSLDAMAAKLGEMQAKAPAARFPERTYLQIVRGVRERHERQLSAQDEWQGRAGRPPDH